MDTPAPAQASSKRDPKAISQSPESTGCYLRGSQRKTIHFHVLDASSNSSSAHFHIFEAEQVVLAVAAAMGTMKRNTQGGNLLGMTGCAGKILGPFT